MKNSFRHALAVFAIALLPATYLSAQADVAAGSKTFSTNCAGCHGSDGRGGERAPNIATARNIVSLTDKDLAGFIRNGIPGSGMPAFGFLGDNGVRDIVAFLRQLQGKTTADVKLTGDQTSGRSLFFGQAGCSSCHMMHGEGGFLASDLSDYGSGIAPDRIRQAIVDPQTFVTPGTEVVEVTTPQGESLHGVLRAEDNFNIVLQLENGRYRRLAKSSLRKFARTGHSLMPADYGSRLSPVQIDDIVTFLVRSADPIDPSSHRRRPKDDE